jgi:hypothetical protein
MNVLNILSSTLTKQRTTYFQQRGGKKSTRIKASIELAQARQFNLMNKTIMLDEVCLMDGYAILSRDLFQRVF